MGKAKRVDAIKSGYEYFNWKVLEFSHINESGVSCWKCICECGRFGTVTEKVLRWGHGIGCRKCAPRKKGGGRKSILDERHIEAAALYESGMTVENVASKMAVSLQTITRWLDKMGVARRKREPRQRGEDFIARILQQIDSRLTNIEKNIARAALVDGSVTPPARGG